MGLYFEEFELGRSLATRARTVGEGDISLFAGLVGDFNPLHVDEQYSAGTPFGGRIAHGPLTMSMAIGLMSQLNLIDGTALALLNINWDFRGPVRIGDTVHAQVTPTERKPTSDPSRGIVTLRFEVMNQRDETIQVGAIMLLMRRRMMNGE